MLTPDSANACPTTGDCNLVRRALFGASLLVLLAGCATNSVTTLMKASRQRDAIMPRAEIVQGELKGRAFQVGNVAFDLQRAGDKQGPDIPDSAYLELFDSQLRKAFAGAALGTGTLPAFPVNVAIEELILKSASFIDETSKFQVAEISTLLVRMEIVGENGAILMRDSSGAFFRVHRI